MASEKVNMSLEEAIEVIKSNYPTSGYVLLQNALDMALELMQEKVDKTKMAQ